MTNDFSVTLTYQQRGTRPPIFVAGTFTEPPWTPQEMECTSDKNGDLVFSKTCALKPGEDVQYKFRVGTGDWWVLDEGSPTARDPQGNVNNILRATPSAEDDAYGGRPRASTSATLEGNGHDSVNGHDSATNLLKGSSKRAPTYGAISEQAGPIPAKGNAEARRADDTTTSKTTRRGWFSRILRKIWVGIGSFFGKLFRRNTA